MELKYVAVGVGAAVFAFVGAAASSPFISISDAFSTRGAAIFDGVSQGAYSLNSNDPLVADPSAPGPNVSPTGDDLLFGNYDFPLTRPSAIVFNGSILNPYSTWTTLTVTSVEGQPDSVPISLEATLPSPYTSTVAVFSNQHYISVNEPVVYNTSNIFYGDYTNNGQEEQGGESITFTRVSAGVLDYSGSVVFYDPVMSTQLLDLKLSGQVSITRVGSAFSISDKDSWLISSPVDVQGAEPALIITGKSTDTTLYSGPIPEPGAYVLMILGVGAIGSASRSSRGRCGPTPCRGCHDR